ncbi:glycosyltransferase [Aquabacter spiritensis]|uniref:Glycosyl transferase family 2 n=1 Tax=Aquabacter spiritensis TaxID=933073 RepID=A0A4R3M0N0_9HYPH|nr:glycosyltransferase [Aquabacter spiritensis]TCT06580.1 glycosyl transferase family 2 [Aquabacter spiritensis]
MKLDVILATYNRADILRGALESFAVAARPFGARVRLVVVDNNSTDHTAAVVAEFRSRWPGACLALFEPKQGKHHALNCAMARIKADLVGQFDDDERLAPDWVEVIFANMADPATDFIGGPVVPEWDVTPPDWLPRAGYGGVLGLVDNGPVRRRYGEPGFPAMLTGANFAMRRVVLAACGPYRDGDLYAEDRYMWNQLMRLGAQGWWVPELAVRAKVPAKRLTKAYYRRWAFQEGRTLGKETRQAGGTLLGAPRWLWGEALRNAATSFAGLVRPMEPSRRFLAEIELRKFAGYYIARNLPFIRDTYYSRA